MHKTQILLISFTKGTEEDFFMQKQSVKNKTAKPDRGKIKAVLLPILYSLLLQSCFFVAACILSLLIGISRSDYYLACVVALSLGSAAAGFASGKIKGERGMLYGTLFTLPSNVIYIFLSVALNGFSFDYNLFLSFAVLVVCSAVGGIVSVNTRSKPRIKKPKRSKR